MILVYGHIASLANGEEVITISIQRSAELEFHCGGGGSGSGSTSSQNVCCVLKESRDKRQGREGVLKHGGVTRLVYFSG
jgi:hypothetical protein